jgi:cation diffusion facilitator CzcD-associated flavoprotein CzcO
MGQTGAPGEGASKFDVVIIGAGFGGILAGIKLKQAGVGNFVILEKDDGVGGTWWANTYPGCACDVQSHLYSYSFEPKPDWSHMFGRQPEIRDYLQHCVDKYGLAQHLRLSTEVTCAKWQEDACLWRVSTADGGQLTAPFMIAAIGGLSRPAWPDIPGMCRFAGPSFHSAQWDHSVDLAGKTVAVIGTGASAIQIVPEIAGKVARLHLFQRTPPWVIPRPDRRVSGFERRSFLRFPVLQRLWRWLLYWRLESRGTAFVVFPRMGALVEKLGRWNIRRGIEDPALRMAVTPEFPAGCKRVLLSDDYYPALARSNVHVVTRAIREIKPSGIVTGDGVETPVDVIVWCTGFKATDPVPSGLFVGRDGLDLTRRWRDGLEAYLGMTVSGFPNLFILNGPNTGLGHNSVVFMLEAQMRYVMDAINRMRRDGIRALEVRRDVEQAFNARLQERLAGTVWASGCRSWYLDANGRNTTLWPGFTVEYWWRTRHFRPHEFALPDARSAQTTP